MKRALRLLAIATGAIAVLLVALILWWNAGERKRIHDAAIASAHLDAIPDPNYKAVTRGGMFSRTYWIVFTCSETQFENFVASSAGLRGVTPYVFPFVENQAPPTTTHQPPENKRKQMREAESFWDVVNFGAPVDPSFWNPSPTRKKGRRYEIQIPGAAISGFLLRDDESGEAFLRVSYS